MMLTLAFLATGAVLVLSTPHWLPAAIVALRMRIFIRINGEEGIAIPGELVDAAHFRHVYSHPAASGRSRGAALSDLFWYWLSPGPEIHQEHIEAGERYEEIAHTTRRILALSRTEAEELAQRCLARLVWPSASAGARLVRLRDWVMPVWAEFYYELVFGRPCPPDARRLIVAHANDVATALKCTGLRHMRTRGRLTQFLIRKLEAGELPHTLPERLSIQERALYLQGVFFNTGVVQTSEAMVHLFMVLAQHADVQRRVAERPDDEQYIERVIDETLRVYPLFGISHRITSADIDVDGGTTIPSGSVLCFNHAEYHRTGFEEPDRFDPDRWKTRAPRDSHYIPFGVPANRPCPASGMMPVVLRTATRALVARFAFYTSASHTRSIPNRGPCLVVPRASSGDPRVRSALLLFVRLRDRWEDVARSIVQLLLGSYMVWDARRLRLCRRHFEAHGPDGVGPPNAAVPVGCPIRSHAGVGPRSRHPTPRVHT